MRESLKLNFLAGVDNDTEKSIAITHGGAAAVFYDDRDVGNGTQTILVEHHTRYLQQGQGWRLSRRLCRA